MVLMARQYNEFMRNKYCHGILNAQTDHKKVQIYFNRINQFFYQCLR
jgi:hypothetical protein